MTFAATHGDWWQSFYDDTFADVVFATGAEAGERAGDFIASVLQLEPGARVFDQCCGNGRVSIPLARRGFRVVGVDAIAAYAERGTAVAREEGLDCDLRAGDAFTFVPDVACDAAINWSTSFGYTPDDMRNVLMLRRAFESLRPGGRFALDYYAVPHLLRTFQDRMVVTHATPAGDVVVEREARLDYSRGLVEQHWTYRLADGRTVERIGTTRLYMPHELHALVSQAGFADVALLGADGSAYSLASPRCIVVGTRPR